MPEPAWLRRRSLRQWWSIFRRLWAVKGPGLPGRRGRDLGRVYGDLTLSAQGVKAGAHPDYLPRGAAHLDGAALAVKALAFYLPQFHPIPENDAWWGKGFTEWTNVARAAPQFVGHYQPRLPGDLGYYDLRLPEVLAQQVAMARQHGLYGFCFHHYWFNGRRLLERPVQRFLADKALRFRFCLSWANESWSRRWDGTEKEILMAQTHSPKDDLAFLESLLPAMRDPRYIRVGGKPLLLVYRPGIMPDPRATALRWRKRALRAGLPGLYLVAARSFETRDPTALGFDAVAEFPPHQIQPLETTHRQRFVNAGYWGHVYSYADMAKRFAAERGSGYTNLKGVAVSWDNEARRPGRGSCYAGSTPALYAQWLEAACKATLEHPKDERLVFINAWNEWAEGAYLEPDRKFGYAYLRAGAEVLAKFRRVKAAAGRTAGASIRRRRA